MAVVGYHASHEQFSPRRLLRLVSDAEQAGFAAAMCSDHFHPWTRAQGQSGYAWSWLGSALEATNLSMGVVTVPGYRYHPAVTAQACATLAKMYAGRFWVAVGSGEALNESITGGRWPAKDERNARLFECASVMRALWSGATVTHRGLVTVEGAKLYSLPRRPPMLVGAALSAETAEWMGGWADGLITIAQDRGAMRAVLSAFRDGGGHGKPVMLQAQVSVARTDALAVRAALEQWAALTLRGDVLAELRSPEQFEAAAANVRAEDVARSVRCSADLGRHRAWLEEDLAMGYDAVYVHCVHPDQEAFIRAYGRHVLPSLEGAGHGTRDREQSVGDRGGVHPGREHRPRAADDQPRDGLHIERDGPGREDSYHRLLR